MKNKTLVVYKKSLFSGFSYKTVIYEVYLTNTSYRIGLFIKKNDKTNGAIEFCEGKELSLNILL